jgi:hypothetical protein
MAWGSAEGRQELLDTIVEATDEMAIAVASLGAAYERLDEPTADRLEEELFRPLQLALGRAKRAHEAFAARHSLPEHKFAAGSPGQASARPKASIERAVDAISRADGTLATLQDSPMALELGDVELRAGLADVRELIGGFGQRARGLLRTLGR